MEFLFTKQLKKNFGADYKFMLSYSNLHKAFRNYQLLTS